MKIIAVAAVVFLSCLVAGAVSAGDCSGVSDQIAVNKNNPRELRRLANEAPQCGEIWEALGDYYYGRKVWNEAQESYQKALNLMPGKKKLESRLHEIAPKATALIKDENDMLAYRRGLRGTTESLSGSPSLNTSSSPEGPGGERLTIASAQENTGAAENTTSQRPRSSDSKKTTARRVKLASSGGSAARQTKGHKAEKVGLVIVFDFNSSQLTEQSKKFLSEFAGVLNGELAGRRFLVEGNTDNVGERQYNMQLSLARAESVKAYLSSNGVAPGRLDVRGFGSDKPIYDNATEEGRARNRRVEFEEK